MLISTVEDAPRHSTVLILRSARRTDARIVTQSPDRSAGTTPHVVRMLVGIVAAIGESRDGGGWSRSLLAEEHDM
jgi:hypothetical protein